MKLPFTRSQIWTGFVVIVAAVLCAKFVHPFAGLAPFVPVAFGALSVQAQSDIGRQLAAFGFRDPSGGHLLPPAIPKTADYTILDPFTATTGGDPSGTTFTNRGAGGAVNFTLPAPVPRLNGCYYSFLGHADQTILVKTATADTLIALNDVAADSVSAATAGGKICSRIVAFCDGISWFAWVDHVGVTETVAT